METTTNLRGLAAGFTKRAKQLLALAILASPLAASAYWEYYDDGYYVYSYWVDEYSGYTYYYGYDYSYSSTETNEPEDPWANLNEDYYGG